MFTFPVCMFAGGGAPKKSLEFDGSTDYLSMSDANFGSYDLAKWAFACSFRQDAAASGVLINKDNNSFGTGEFKIGMISTSGFLEFTGLTANETALLRTNSATIAANNWYAVLFHFDSAAATANDRMRMWINGVEVTSFNSRTNPTAALSSSSAAVEIGYWSDQSSGYFDGLIYQPTFFSGSLPAPADVFDGTSGKLKDLSGLTGVHSSLDASTATNDVILATDWTNNGTVTTSTTIP